MHITRLEQVKLIRCHCCFIVKIRNICCMNLFCDFNILLCTAWHRLAACTSGVLEHYQLDGVAAAFCFLNSCVSKLNTNVSDNYLSPSRRQALVWTNAGILLIRTLEAHFSEILSKINTFSLKKMHLKVPTAKWRPFCLGLNVLMQSSSLTLIRVSHRSATIHLIMGPY